MDPTIREFLRENHRAHLEATTFADYSIQVGHFEKFAEERLSRSPRLSDLTVNNLTAAIAWLLDKGSAKASVDKFRRSILAVWNKAASLDEFGVAPPPPKRIRPLKLPKAEPLAWSIEEFEKMLLAAAELEGNAGPFRLSAFFSAVLWTVYNSGLRISAAMAIETSWIDLDQRRLIVDPEVQKDDEGTTVVLLPETVEALRPLVAGRRGRVFGDWQFDRRELASGRPPRALTRTLKKCLVSAGLAESINRVSRRDLWHKIRRTFATACYAASGDIELVREMLGHSSITVTWRYIDKTKLHRRTQADLLPRPRPTQLRLFGG